MTDSGVRPVDPDARAEEPSELEGRPESDNEAAPTIQRPEFVTKKPARQEQPLTLEDVYRVSPHLHPDSPQNSARREAPPTQDELDELSTRESRQDIFAKLRAAWRKWRGKP